MTYVSARPSLAERARGWRYAAITTNPPEGHVDAVAKWIVLTRAAVLPMTIFAGMLGLLLAVHAPGFSWGWGLLAVAGVLAAHIANNMMNDLFDTDVGQDTPDYPRALYAPHPILSGLTTRRQLVRVVLGVNLIDLVILIVLTIARGPWILAFGLGGFLLSAAYTAPPLRLKKRGLGELDVFITWGPLMVGGVYFAATGRVPGLIWVASLPYALLCTAVLLGKHIDKIAYDEPLGIRTVPVLLGRRRALDLTTVVIGLFYISVILDVVVGALSWPALLALGGLWWARPTWKALAAPPPEQPPPGFPVWPLWYGAWAFVHTRNAGSLLLLGVIISTAVHVKPF